MINDDDEVEYNSKDLIGQMIPIKEEELSEAESPKKDSAKKRKIKRTVKQEADFEFDVDRILDDENNDYTEDNNNSNIKEKKKKRKSTSEDEYEEDDRLREEIDRESDYDEEGTYIKKKKHNNSNSNNNNNRENRENREKKKKKTKKKEKRYNFIEDYADEDEGSESDPDIVGEVNDNELRKIEAETLQRKNQRLRLNNNDFTEELAKRYENAEYEDIEDDIDNNELIDEEEDNYNRQPKTTDPKLWLVKCRKGKERENVNILIKKYFFNNKTMNLKIFSAFSIDALKGYIYVEAYKEANVREAVIGVSNIKADSIKQVPMHEMTQVLNFDRLEKVELKNGQWVRIKSGLYEGDLAQIVDIEDSASKIWIKIIPRMFENTEKMKIGDYSKQIKGSIKPKQQFFNPNANRDNDVQERTHPFLKINMSFWRSKYFKDGFFIKCAKLRSLQHKDIIPRIEELRIFESANDKDKEANFLDSLYRNVNDLSLIRKNKYLKGEKVRLFCGNLQGIVGEVVSHEGETVKMIPNVEGLDDELEVPEQYLTRYFLPGDLVTVEKDTRYKGMSGIVVKTNDDVATIYNEGAMNEFKVSMDNIILSSKVGKGEGAVGSVSVGNSEFKQYDLVACTGLGGNTYCLVLDLAPFKLTVMDLKAKVSQIALSQAKKINTNKHVGVDFFNNPLSLNDCVKIIKGPNRGKKAVIKCLFKKHVFLYNTDYTQTFGIFLDHTANTQIMGSELLEEDQNRVKINVFSIPDKVKKLIGKHVRITRGQWKMHVGVLKNADQNRAKVELLSRNKTVTVDIDDVVDYNNKEISGEFVGTPAYNVNKTPGYYPQSPNVFGTGMGGVIGMGGVGGSSPKWTSATPNHWSQSPYHMASPNTWK